MSEEILIRAEEYLTRRRNRVRMLRAFTAMALVVAIMTSYVLMLPGLTLESETYCGYNEHAHGADCYVQELICTQEERPATETVVKILQCSFRPHTHTDACRAPDGSIGCGISTSYWHRHSAECYDEAKNLVCTLVNNPKHRHDDSCYEQLATLVCTTAETAGHVHNSSCYGRLLDAEPTCGLVENDGHVHTAECTSTVTTLVCSEPEATSTDLGGHVHSDACYHTETVSNCTLAGGEGAHTHTDACYPVSTEPTCGLAEGEGGHSHGHDCYTYEKGELKCDLLHDHNGNCYDPETGYVTCGKVYLIEHNHSAYCLRNVTAIDEGHTHGEACYTRVYTCGHEEHAHTAECFVNPNPETPEVEPTEPVSTTNMPTVEPTVAPTAEPTAEPTVEPTVEPTAEPTVEPTVEPTAEPTVEPTVEPTTEPTVEPTVEPTTEPTVEPTVEPTAEPTVEPTVEPTAEPTVEPTVEPTTEPTVEPTVEPTTEPTVEPTVEPTTEPTVEPTVEPTTEPTVEPTVEPTTEPTVEPTAEPTTEPTVAPSVEATELKCDLPEHVHSAECYDENGEETCGLFNHIHSVDCYYVCGEVEHTHSETFDGGVPMTLSYVEHVHENGCYDENGELVCSETEHVHNEMCLFAAPRASSVRADFSQYISQDKNHSNNGVTVKPGSTVVYDPETGDFITTLQFNFAIPNYVLKGYGGGWVWSWWGWIWDPGAEPITSFYYELPDTIEILPEMLNTRFSIKSAGGKTEGTFQIVQQDGKYVILIDFDKTYLQSISAGSSKPGTPVANTPYSQGQLYFECIIDSSTVQDNGEIREDFTYDDVLVIPGNKIEYPDGETANHQISTSKSGRYEIVGNKLIYTVKVSSTKGTPSHIKVEDTLTLPDIMKVAEYGTPTVVKYTETANGWGGWDKVSGSETTLSYKEGGHADMTDTQFTAKRNAEGKLDMHLPQIVDPADGTRTTYEITYEIELDDFEEFQFSENVKNSVVAKSETSPGNKVEASAESSVHISKTMLDKRADNYDQATDSIHWTVTLNDGRQDIAGGILTDTQFSSIEDVSSIVVKKNNGETATPGVDYIIETDGNGTVTGIRFPENNNGQNTDKYVIEYDTKPSADATSVTNNAKFEDDGKTIEKGQTVTIDRTVSYSPYKSATGSSLNKEEQEVIISWRAELTISSWGLNEDVLVTDTINSTDNAPHYMTLSQMKELYNSIKDQEWFKTGCGGVFYVKQGSQLVNIETVLANESAYADPLFSGFEFTIDDEKLPESYNGKKIEITYKTTGETDNVTTETGGVNYTNGWGVGPDTSNGSHWYEPSKPVVPVIKYDGNWNTNETTYDSKTGELQWIVRINQDSDCDVLKIVDTLPEDVELVKVELGMYTQSTLTPDENGNLVYNKSYHDGGLSMSGTYTGNTVTIFVQKDNDAQDWEKGQTAAFGAGKTFDLKFCCKIKSDRMPTGNPDGSSSSKSFLDLTNHVDVYMDNNPDKYGEASQTQNITVKSETRVTKYLASTNNKTGELTWKVEVYQEKESNKLVISDTLPETYVGLKTVTVGAGSVLTYDAGAVADSDGFVQLSLTSQAGGDMGLTISGKYNPSTNEVIVTITRNDGATINSSVWGEGKKFPLSYACTIKDEYLPDIENDEYEVDFKNLINDVDVWSDDTFYGSASTNNDFSVEYDRPQIEAGGKSHEYKAGMQTLSYRVEINPSAADMDPSKNMISVTDLVSYQHNDGSYNRKLSLIKDSVKLYYADYDAYGKPLKDANGNLIKGQEVSYSDWTMAYYENFIDDSWSTSTCTMELSVPDARALILEYDYLVEMNEVDGWDNLLRITNKVTVRGSDSQEYGDQTGNEDVFREWTAGGNISSEDTFTITKVDSLNHALVLPGAAFEVQEWNPDADGGKGAWEYALTYYTDSLGVFTVMYNPESDENVYEYEANRAYRVIEKVAPYGYELPSTETYYYFYWSDDEPNAPEIKMPDDFLLNAVNLTNNAHDVLIENNKRATSMEVEKIWLDADGNPLNAGDIPGSITVHLKRYAIPADVWEANADRYNSGVTEELERVTVKIMDHSEQYNISFARDVVKGAILKFDVVITDKSYGSGGSGFSPMFDNLPAGTKVSSEIVGNTEVYHYAVPIDEPIDIVGHFRQNPWWGWTGPLNGALRFSSITLAFDGSFDDSSLYVELDGYRDRNYNNSMTLTKAGNWKGIWENLDVIGKDENGREVHYKYFIVEESPSGFATSISGGSNDLSGKYTITNTKDDSETITTSLRVIKEWYDENGLRVDTLLDEGEGIEVRLYQRDNLTGREIVYPYNGFPTTVINANTNWEFFFSNLPYQTKNAQGKLIQSYSYRIEEVTKGDFTTELVITDDSGIMLLSDEPATPQVIIRNTKKHPVDITVIKEWSDEETHSEVIIVQLYREKLTADGYVADTTFSEADTDGQPLQQEISAGNGWTYTWLDLPDSGWLPKMDSSGNPVLDEETGEAILESVSYRYLVKEISIDGKTPAEAGYYPTYSTSDGAVPNDGSMTITNSKPAQLEIEKQWVDDNENLTDAPVDAVYFELMKDGVNITNTLTQATNGVIPLNGYIKVSAADGWKVSIIGLEEGVYTLVEYMLNEETGEYEPTDAATYEISSTGTGADTDFVVQNTVQTQELTIRKTWAMADGTNTPVAGATASFTLWRRASDGSADTDITSTLTQDTNGVALVGGAIQLSADSNWTAVITDLPAKSDDGKVTYTYYVKENAIGGFAAEYSNSMDGNTFTAVKNNGFITVTNRQEVTSVSVAKSWQDANGSTIIAPSGAKIVVALYRTGNVNTTPVQVGEYITLPTSDGMWRATVNNLPKMSSDGNEQYSYYFEEVSVEGIDGFMTIYDPDNSAVKQAVPNDSGVAIIINRAESTSVKLAKSWLDTDGTNALTNEDLLPEEVTVTLYQRAVTAEGDKNPDGGVVYNTYKLTSEDGWKLDVTDLPKFTVDSSGNVIYYEYIIKEDNVTGFITTDPTAWVKDDTSTLTVTNTLTKLDVSVQKIWTEGSTPINVSMTVKRYILHNGSKVIDESFAEPLTFTTTNYTTAQKLTGLPAYGVLTNPATNSVAKGAFHYYVEEDTTNLGEQYEVTYSANNSTIAKENGIDSSITETGTLKVTNRERTKLTVRKIWDGNKPLQDEVEVSLYRRKVAKTDTGDSGVATVAETDGTASTVTKYNVTFHIGYYPDWEGWNGNVWYDFITPVTRVYEENTTVTWNAILHIDHNQWHPSAGSGAGFTVEDMSGNQIKSITCPNAAETVHKVAEWPSEGVYLPGDYEYKYTVNIGAVTQNIHVYFDTNGHFTVSFDNTDNRYWRSNYVPAGEEPEIQDTTDDNEAIIGDAEYIETVYLNKGNEWHWDFYDLPTESDDGQYDYQYFIVEDTEGYETTYNPSNATGGITSGELTVTNKKIEPPAYTLRVVKNWVDIETGTLTDPPANAKVVFQLWREVVSTGEKTQMPSVIEFPTTDGNWYTTLSLSPTVKVTVDGVETYELVRYYVIEESCTPSGYIATYDNGAQDENGTWLFTPMGNGTITVTNAPEATQIIVQKKWVDGTGAEHTPPANVQARFKVFNNYGQEMTAYNFTLPDENGSWTKTVNNLPKKNSDGSDASYYVVEQTPETVTTTTNADGTKTTTVTGTLNGFTIIYTNGADNHSASASDSAPGNEIVVSNKFPTTNLIINKQWFDHDGTTELNDGTYPEALPDSVKVMLYYRTTRTYQKTVTTTGTDGTTSTTTEPVTEKGTETLYSATPYVLTGPNWTLNITDLPAKLTDAAGNICDVEYIVREVDAGDNYTAVNPEDYVAGGGTLTVKNVHDARLVVNKQWFENGTNVTASKTDADAIRFSLYRTAVTGGTTLTTRSRSGGLTTQSRADTVSVTVYLRQNEWQDYSLFAEGEFAPGTTVTVVLNNKWGAENSAVRCSNFTLNDSAVTGVKVSDSTEKTPDGYPTTYTYSFVVGESEMIFKCDTGGWTLTDFSASVSSGGTVTPSNPEPVVTPTPTLPPTVVEPTPTPTPVPGATPTPTPAIPDPVVGQKVTYNGQTEFVLNQSNNWQYVFDDLPEKDSAGRTYQYFVVEAPVDGYTTTYEPNNSGADGELLIKNSKTIITHTYLTVNKVWQGEGVTADDQQPIKFRLWRKEVARDAEEDLGNQPTVQITFNVVNADGTVESTVTKTLVQGATYKWVPYINAASNATGVSSGATATYNGKTYNITRTSSAGVLPVKYSMIFTADVAGTITFNTGVSRTDTWSHTFTVVSDAETTISTTTRAATLSLQPRASDVVDSTNATPIGEYELNSAGKWAMAFMDLPAVSSDGKYTYLYFVEEIDVPYGFEVHYSDNNANGVNGNAYLTITNKKIEITNFDLSVEKRWIDSEGNVMTAPPQNATVTLELHQVATMADGTKTDKVYETDGAVTLSGETWTHTFADLPSGTEDGSAVYSYYVKESAATNAYGFTVSYSNADGSGGFILIDEGNAADGVTITNTQKPTRLSILKQWKNSDGSNLVAPSGASVTMKLYRKTGLNDTADPVLVANITLNKDNSWEWISKTLPAIDPATNKTYYYFVEETEVLGLEGVTFNVSLPQYPASGGQLRVTNTVQTTSIRIDKQWIGADGNLLTGDEGYLPEKITVTIQRRIKSDTAKEADWKNYGYETYDVTAEKDWTLTVTDLPVFTTDSTGARIDYEYRVVEQAVDGYTTSYQNNDGVSDADSAIIVRNTMIPMTYRVTKVYAENSPTRPQVTVNLICKITENGKTLSKVYDTITLPYKPEGSAEETWMKTWENLPTIGSITIDGETVNGPCVYTAVEVELAGFFAVYSHEDTQTTITNIPTELKVEKQWLALSTGQQTAIKDREVYYQILQYKLNNNGEYLDSDSDGKPDAVVYTGATYPTRADYVSATQTYKMTDTNGTWPTITHYELPIYWIEGDVKQGEYRYSIVETDAAGNVIAAEYDNSMVDVRASETITMVNTVTSIPVQKYWSDVYGALPENLPEVTLVLHRRTGQIGEDGTLEDDFEASITLTQEMYTAGVKIWKYTWENLDAYGYLDGELVQWYYYVEEVNVADGFMHLPEADMNNLGITGQYGSNQVIGITNALIVYELPETGGAGTTPYTVCGLLMLALAAMALMYKEFNPKKVRGEGNES